MPANATLDDDTLIRRAVSGETECFTVLVHRHIGALKNHVRGMLRNTTETDDLVQEVLLKAWLHLPAFRFESSFRSWAIRIATNEVLQLYRRQRRTGVHQPVDDLNMIASPIESPIQCVVRVERERTVRRAISRLPIKYRQILQLRCIQEWDERETARYLRSSIASVRSRSFRARKMLRSSLQRVRFDAPIRPNLSARQEARLP